ncbi:MAG: FtsW/RodA/SpoVE family cell cycle protein [Ruminococcus sp.]|nr:FtsW/RodA/SpoVE family cell cycle protein [Ruminococcus sp.]
MFDRGMGLDLPFLLLVLVLLVIGMIMMFSASFPVAYYNLGDSYYYIKRQAIFAAIGLAAMILLSFFNYNKLHKVAALFIGISWVLLVVVLLVPGDVHRWFAIGNFNVQPSEIAKFSIIVFFAHWGSMYYDKMQYAKYSVLPGLVVFGVTAALLVLEPHFSGIVIIGILTVVMLYLGGMKVRYLVIGLIILFIAVLIAAVTGMLSYAMERMDGWGQALNYTSASDPEMWNTTWQTRNSLYAIGSGGLFGLGLGNSRQKFLYLPEPQNDFVFAIVCEEIGYIGALIILLIFALLVWRGITLSLRSKDRFGKLLGIGLSAQIGIQVVLNILVITDWLPNTGISLPFFSYGGSSLIMLLAQMGLILSISRTANIEKQ